MKVKTPDHDTFVRVATTILAPEERDVFGILRFRTPSRSVAYLVAEQMEAGGYGVNVLGPSKTWHEEWAVSCWGDHMMTSKGSVPISK